MKTLEKSIKVSKTRDTLINLIQASLVGKINSGVDFRPQFLADAIISKTEFDKPFNHQTHHVELISSIRVFIDSLKEEMSGSLSELREDETILKNFINGQITACDKFEEFITKL
jgi:hypothetical protein